MGNHAMKKTRLFDPGQIVSTPAALAALQAAGINPQALLDKHLSGEWGDLTQADKEENDFSLANGYRILSAYEIEPGLKIWLITEADRSATTFLLPEDY